MQNNVFNEDVGYLYQVQTDLEAVEQMKSELAQYRNQEKNLKKAIAAEEKSIQDEIAQTIRRRKNEIEKVYDDQIDANKSKNRSVRMKRDKAKSKRMDERVSVETADLAEENRQLQVEMRTLFKAQHVPSFCMSKLFYSLFMTKRLAEVMILLLAILITYVGIPFLMYFLSVNIFFKGDRQITFLCTLTVAVTLIIPGLIYIWLLNAVKVKHYDTLAEGRAIRDKMAANKRQMKAIRNKISKDKDESAYGLDKYDDKLSELQEELNQISQEKQDAMTLFENETKQLLTDEVNDRRLGRLEEMKEELEAKEEQITLLDEDIQNSSLAIANNYGTILGKEFCTPAKVADLISLMEDGTADTVSEAIAAYKGAGR
ncbi:MAG: hypothetical protein NC300_06145 [Bacteroidales bacterium]|nr:hypothetical protein [Clostridium sp.]MCM1203705.1 hypothetical protein [Bacteroidales bacterium]